MNEILSEFFNRFSPEEQEEITDAEARAQDEEAKGEKLVLARSLLPQSINRDWRLQPQDEARAAAAGIVFTAFSEVLRGQTDHTSRDSIKKYCSDLDRIAHGVLKQYGQFEAGAMTVDLRRRAEECAWLINDRLSILSETPPAPNHNTPPPIWKPIDTWDESGHLEFWSQRQSEFEKFQNRFPTVAAWWRAGLGRWILIDEAGSKAPLIATQILDAVARKALPRLPKLRASPATAPCQLWLSFMRAASDVCEPLGSPIPVSKQEHERLGSGKSLSEVRTEISKAAYEESVRTGRSLAETERDLGLSMKALPVDSFRWIQDERIDRVFQASADFCFVLASENPYISARQDSQQTEIRNEPGESMSSPQPAESDDKPKPVSDPATDSDLQGEPPDLLDALSKDDPNYDFAKRFYLETWADSDGLNADAFAGNLSVEDWINGCVKTFSQGADAVVAFQGSEIHTKRQALDSIAEEFIKEFGHRLASESERLGEETVASAIERLTDRIREVAARSKQRICQNELKAVGTAQSGRPTAAADSVSDPMLKYEETFDFASQLGRSNALAAYTTHWKCSEASLARTAKVNPADLSKWKKGLLPPTSDKKKRIEDAITQNEPPTPAKAVHKQLNFTCRIRLSVGAKSPTLAHKFANAPTLSANVSAWHYQNHDVSFSNCCRGPTA